MSELCIENGIVIDDVENVMRYIKMKAEMVLQAPDAIIKFITNEKYTRYYVDCKMNSSGDPLPDCIYLWLDSGCRDRMGNPLFISLLKMPSGFVGHIVGTPQALAKSIENYYPRSRKYIKDNLARFMNKYRKKSSKRCVAYMKDEQSYLMFEPDAKTEIADKIEKLDLAYKEETKDMQPAVQENVSDVQEECFGEKEKEITISLLWDMLEEKQQFIEKLLQTIKSQEEVSEERIKELNCENDDLKVKNENYRAALVRMRDYHMQEEMQLQMRDAESCENSKKGHSLLQRNKKILVLGATEIGIDDMRGIAKKDYGFEKDDLEFETDYDKVVSASRRIHQSDKYQAVIFGNCPHSVAGKGNWSSIIEEYKQRSDCPFSVDARTEGGGLKMTKTSFRKALQGICIELMAG